MEKIKYIPLALFTSFAIKGLILGINSYEYAASLLIIGSIASWYEFKSQDKKIKELKLQQDEQAKINALILKEVESVKGHITSMKLGNQMRSTTKVG